MNAGDGQPERASDPSPGSEDLAADLSPEVEAQAAEPCDICGALMYGRHCKLVCSNCGYLRDCSDP